MFIFALRYALICAQNCSVSTAALTASLLIPALAVHESLAADFSTANFLVEAGTAKTARHVARRAEELRSQLATEWLGGKLPDWSEPCRVIVDTDAERLTGDTTYVIGRTRITRWRMELHGPLDRILETLLPHEIVHAVLATHFKTAIPRWADEGAALMAEDPQEQQRLWLLEEHRLVRDDQPPLADLLAASEYPRQRDEVRTFYVRGASLTAFLVSAGKTRFLEFVRAGMNDGWDSAVLVHYGFADVSQLEAAWLDWLRADRPAIELDDAQLLAAGLHWGERRNGERVEVAGASNLVRQQSRDPAIDLAGSAERP